MSHLAVHERLGGDAPVLLFACVKRYIDRQRAGQPMVGSIYPAVQNLCLAARAYGICKLHVTVSEAGDVDALEITQSTGSVDLDQACLDAIYDAPFIPARREGKFVSGSTDVVLDWRLPEVVTSPNLQAR